MEREFELKLFTLFNSSTVVFNNLAIDGINVKTECQLHSSLHRLILERAVRIGLLSKSINIDTD